MAGNLPRSISEFKKIPGARIAIIGSMWHADCVTAMIDRTVLELIACEVTPEDIEIHTIPGALELPYAARILLDQNNKNLDAIIAFGVVLQGETAHNTSVLEHVVHGFGLLVDRYAKPVINEVIGVKSIDDAKVRASDKGLEAVFAASEIIHWKRSIQSN